VGEDPDRIRLEIEQTREEMGDTVDALSYKADVKSRAKDSLRERKEAVVGATQSVKDRVVGASPDPDQVKQQAKRAKSVAQENPLGLAVGAIAAGFLAGMLAPSTRVEDERLGPMADDVKDRATQTGQEALERGKQVAQDAAETAKDSAQSHGEDLRDTAKEHAQEATSSR
jgi:gas vesicle protein